MKEIIIDYLIQYIPDIRKIVSHTEIKEHQVDFWKRNYPIITDITIDNDEFEIKLKITTEMHQFLSFSNFSDGLIQRINDKSEKKVDGPNYLGMYSWHSEDLKLSFGVNDEVLQFEARFSFKIESLR
jgi:hypothetical protein